MNSMPIANQAIDRMSVSIDVRLDVWMFVGLVGQSFRSDNDKSLSIFALSYVC